MVIGQTALLAAACLGLEAVDQVNEIVEPAASAVVNQRPGDADRNVRFAGSGSTFF